MSHASLPSLYWDEICSSVVYLINRLPSPSHSGKIPFKELFNKDPDYTFLRTLGCRCFPYTRPYSSHKLEPRSLPCLFLGYAISQKGYRCLHLPTNKLYISRHVQFDEHYFPFKNDPLQPTPLQTETFTLLPPPNTSSAAPLLIRSPNPPSTQPNNFGPVTTPQSTPLPQPTPIPPFSDQNPNLNLLTPISSSENTYVPTLQQIPSNQPSPTSNLPTTTTSTALGPPVASQPSSTHPMITLAALANFPTMSPTPHLLKPNLPPLLKQIPNPSGVMRWP